MTNFECSFCHNKDGDVLADSEKIRFGCYGYDKKIIKCSKCNLVQLFPPWQENELNQLYSQYSQKVDFPGQKRKKEIRKWIKKYLAKWKSTVEVGCGHGDTVNYFADKGYPIIGIDRDPTVCDDNRILNRKFEEWRWVSTIVCAFHVLEHIQHPEKFLEHLHCLLYDRTGEFVLEVPNIEEPLLSLYKVKEYEKFYWYPYHLFFYAPETIKNLFDKVGGFRYKIIRKQRYGIINHLRWFLFRKPGNVNFHIPILDDIYKFVLTRLLRKSDTMIIVGRKI